MLDSAKVAIFHVSHPHEKGRDSHLDHPVHFEKPLDFEDPHRAALEQNPEVAESLSRKTLFAVGFVILGFCAPTTGAFALITGILVPVGNKLDDVVNIGWIVSGWSIAAAVSFSIAGKASDVFGRRPIILIGQAFSILGCIIGCVSQTTLQLVVASTINGWSAGIIWVAFAGIAELLPNKYRNIGLGLTDTVIMIPWSAGAVIIATLLNTHTAAGWRWCYYIGIIYGVPSLAGTFLFYHPPSRPQYDYGKSRWQEIKDMDYIGLLLFAGGFTIMLIGLSWGGTAAHPWGSASTLVPLTLGAMTIVACFVYDSTIAREPLFPPQLMGQFREYTILLLVVFVAGMVYFSMSGLAPQAVLYIFTDDQIEIGLISLAPGIGLGIVGGFGSLFIGKIGHLKIQILVLIFIQTLFIALYSVAIPNNRNAWMGFQFFGYGAFAPITILCYLIAGLNVPLKYLGVASGLIGTFRCFGGGVGNAIFTSILDTIVNKQLAIRIGAVIEASGLPSSTTALVIPAAVSDAEGVPNAFAAIAGLTPAIEEAIANALRESYVYGFQRVFWSTIPFGVLAFGCACLLNDPSIYLTNHTALKMENEKMVHEKDEEAVTA